MYVRLPSATPRRSLLSHLAWFSAVLGLIAVVGLVLATGSTPEGVQGTLAAADGGVQDGGVQDEEADAVDVADVAAFDQAIEEQTRQADEAVLQAEVGRLFAEAEAARIAAEQEAARVAAEAEALRATVRHSGVGRSSDSQWAALRNCESSGNYAAVSSTGAYRGAYQFSQQTWNSVASAHHPWLVGVDPATASPADQDAQARALYQMSGRGQWPHCGRHLS